MDKTNEGQLCGSTKEKGLYYIQNLPAKLTNLIISLNSFVEIYFYQWNGRSQTSFLILSNAERIDNELKFQYSLDRHHTKKSIQNKLSFVFNAQWTVINAVMMIITHPFEVRLSFLV